MKNITLPIRFGLVTSAVLIAYFLILSLMEYHTNVFFSLFNGVITGFALYEATKVDQDCWKASGGDLITTPLPHAEPRAGSLDVN